MSTTLVNSVGQIGPLRLPFSFAGGEVLVFALRPWSPGQSGIFGAVAAQVFDYSGVAPLLDANCLGNSFRLIEGSRRLVLPVESERFQLEIRPAPRVSSYVAQVVHIGGGDPQPVSSGSP